MVVKIKIALLLLCFVTCKSAFAFRADGDTIKTSLTVLEKIRDNQKKCQLQKAKQVIEISINEDSVERYGLDICHKLISTVSVIKQVAKNEEYNICYTFLDNRLFNILVKRNRKVGFLKSEKQSASYYFSDDNVIYKEEKNLSGTSVNIADLISRANGYIDKGKQLLGNVNNILHKQKFG